MLGARQSSVRRGGGRGCSGAVGLLFSPSEKEGGILHLSAGRAERRKRTEAALEPAGQWLWGSCWGGLGHPWEQRAWCEPLAGRPGCRMSCLPELSDWCPGDWRLWAWRGPRLQAGRTTVGRFAARDPGLFLLVLLSQAVVVFACFHVKLTS